MKNIVKSLFVITLLGLFSCSPQVKPYSAEVNFINKEAAGTITVKSTGYGNNREKAMIDAQKNAFRVILFKGLPGTQLNVPMVDNENDARSNNASYFEKLFDQEFYKTFIMSSTPSSNLVKVKGGKKIEVNLKINYNSLRIDLEQNKIIRKFGF